MNYTKILAIAFTIGMLIWATAVSTDLWTHAPAWKMSFDGFVTGVCACLSFNLWYRYFRERIGGRE
jgi:hypothetical protein